MFAPIRFGPGITSSGHPEEGCGAQHPDRHAGDVLARIIIPPVFGGSSAGTSHYGCSGTRLSCYYYYCPDSNPSVPPPPPPVRQVLLLVASESGTVTHFATPKFEAMLNGPGVPCKHCNQNQNAKDMIERCLTADDDDDVRQLRHYFRHVPVCFLSSILQPYSPPCAEDILYLVPML